MKQRLFHQALALALSASLLAPAFAQDTKQKPHKPLETKDDPTLVGKRDINKGQLDFYSAARETALGRQMAAEVDRESPLVSDPLITEYINRVAQNIVLHSDSKVPFVVKVIDSADVNAFALPGGFLYVNRGLLEAAENEAELAGVLSHEIAHVAARHGIEQQSKGQLINYASIPLIFMGGLGGYIIQQAAGLLVPLTFLKFSRGAEEEADRLGAQYMWASGYDPHALITFFEKLQAKDKKKPGTIAKVFSTHPMTGDRITKVSSLVTRFPERNEYQLSSSEFGQVRARVLAASSAARVASREANDRRPTLKRRPQTQSDDGTTNNGAPDRPVLKRRDGSPADDTPLATESAPGSESSSGSETGRPTLKRSGAQASEPAPPATAPEAAPPTLKRNPDAPSRDATNQ